MNINLIPVIEVKRLLKKHRVDWILNFYRANGYDEESVKNIDDYIKTNHERYILNAQ